MSSNGAVFIWQRNVQETVTWLLCSKLLPIHRNVAISCVTKYLFDKKFLFDPDLGITWTPKQLLAFQALHKPCSTTFVDMPKCSGKKMCVAGIVASLMLRERDYHIKVFATDKRSCMKVLRTVFDMIVHRREVLVANAECIRIKEGNNSVTVQPFIVAVAGTVVELIICIGMEDIKSRYFFSSIMPILQASHTRLLSFLNMQEESWASRVCLMKHPNGDSIFNVI